MHWTAYDTRTAARATLATALVLATACVVTAFTDEGSLHWATRGARVLPLVPACAALGTWVALARGRVRGEALALEALGRSPWDNSVAAVAGAGGVVLALALLVGVSRIDLAGFFPRVEHASTYRYEDGLFVDTVRGVAVAMDGAILPRPFSSAPDVAGVPEGERTVAALALALAGVAFPLVSARGRPTELRGTLLALVATLVGLVAVFHFAAAGRVPMFACVLPSMGLLAFAAFRYGAEAWPTMRR